MGKGEATRSGILERAMALSSVVGLEGLSIGALADELSLSKSGLFAHFRSKEALQLAVIEQAAERFVEVVIKPTLAADKGEPRLHAAFERWRAWPTAANLPGGCFFLAAAAEFDDRPGLVRDAIAAQISAWLGTLSRLVRGAVQVGHFSPDSDADQFAFELFGLLLAAHQVSRLLGDDAAYRKAHVAFEALLARYRVQAPAGRARKPSARSRR